MNYISEAYLAGGLCGMILVASTAFDGYWTTPAFLLFVAGYLVAERIESE
jgi:hypothetical protein